MTACAVGFAAGGAYDAIQTIFAAIKIIEDAEKKLAELAEEKKTCSSKRKDEIMIEEHNLTKIVQYNSGFNVLSSFEPGIGLKTALAGCLVAIGKF